MKKALVVLFVLIYASSSGQQLKYSEWITISGKRVEGNILYNILFSNVRTKYLFAADKVLVSQNEQYEFERSYSIKDNILTIGDSADFRIDSLNEVFLGITEISKKHAADSKLNSFVFINSNFIFDYLKRTQQLTIIDDTIVLCDNAMSPVYKGSIDKLLISEFKGDFTNAPVTGSFLVSPDGNLRQIQIEEIGKVTKRDIKRIKRTLSLTNGAWVMPPTPTPMWFKLDFSIAFARYPGIFSAKIIFNPKRQFTSS